MKKISILSITASLVVSFFLGLAVFKTYPEFFRADCNDNSLQYVNRELLCGYQPKVEKHAYQSLKDDLVDLIDSMVESGRVINVSLYFRDLLNGPTLGINEYEAFTPASLLKVPLLLAYFSLTETRPEVLEDKLVFRRVEAGLEQSFPPADSIEEGKPYSVEELLWRMIKYSDNDAYDLLVEYLYYISPDRDLLKQTYTDLGVIDPEGYSNATVTVKSYSSILVQLYNMSFFNEKKTSEKALYYLANSDFNFGLRAGIPADIQIAHKFGERFISEGDLKQLHDCGIVYHPYNPYLLCVMTRGHDIDTLAHIIASISKMFYEEFNSRKL